MMTTTSLFLAYVNYKKARVGKMLSFTEYVQQKPDLASLILVNMVAREAGIPMMTPRGRKAGRLGWI